MPRLLLLLLAVLALPQFALAQRPTDKWYFGRQAGLDLERNPSPH